ncbi:endonuclease/exonuclease/phosphatase family protein [Flavobacterium sp. J27]|uniref:endonuclease/exonuclease/phosphatase family protein n=1 Tax=Flavobacterium sp. J27 TaxID=2060419 RepID=UPI001F1096C8|nr:endonuclease/exonuclease/phosphatase family protein [Flavobacterium sp. J27]
MILEVIFYMVSGICILVNVLPFIPNQHWFFRVWDFGRIQLLFLLIIVLFFSFSFFRNDFLFHRIIQTMLVLLIFYNCSVLLPYTPLYKKNKVSTVSKLQNKPIAIISVNVYQFNKSYHKLINLIQEVSPDIVLTMESNSDWEQHLQIIEKEYLYTHKATFENTYGMHFYSKLKIIEATTHFFVADDIPSFEIILETNENEKLTFFGVHPPPPSPTEEENSKERDGELLSVAKQVRKTTNPVIVSGDFNNVAWAKSSVLFKKMSQLIDPRIGRGFVSTFHAKYRLLRFPIDLFFHSDTIGIAKFKTLGPIDSDHLPMYCQFYIEELEKNSEKETINQEEKEVVEEMINEGKKEESGRDAVAKA